jgi:hypothetical protein
MSKKEPWWLPAGLAKEKHLQDFKVVCDQNSFLILPIGTTGTLKASGKKWTVVDVSGDQVQIKTEGDKDKWPWYPASDIVDSSKDVSGQASEPYRPFKPLTANSSSNNSGGTAPSSNKPTEEELLEAYRRMVGTDGWC